MNPTNQTIQSLQDDLQGKNPRTILKSALAEFENIGISFSGAEDVILIDMISKMNKRYRVFTLDTGRLHPETYQFIEQVREQYEIDIEVLSPNPETLQQMVTKKGLFSFYQEGHQECCGIRKIEPLKRHLKTFDAWITGQRRDQSPQTRDNIPEVQVDPAFSDPNHTLVKFNPLANWRSIQVWDYIEAYQVPYNKLHRKGYVSIGCEPCTRPILPNQHERIGRWWWEDETKKECGLHTDDTSK
ncbi:MAG: phosphoadenylyl-sulfate reductase [Methylococcaceae bacterium]